MKTNSRAYSCLLSLGHLCADINSGCLSAILPFLIAAHHYDYATATTLVMASNLVCSAVQLFFGSLADRKNRPGVMIAGILLAGAGMGFLGVIPSFGGMCVAVMVSGFGTAMFHPQAMQILNRVSSDGERGNNVSIFSFGGNLGFTLGPLLITACIQAFGLKGTLVLLVPAALSVLLIMTKGRSLLRTAAEELDRREEERPVLRDQWASFGILTAVIFGRSIVAGSLNTFMSLFWIEQLGQSEVVGNVVLSVYYGLSALLTLLGGHLADRYGYQRMIRISLAVLTPAVFLMAFTRTPAVAALLLIPLSAGVSISYSPMVVLGQLYLPNHTGFSSGVTLGLAVSIGGVMAPLLGKVADASGLSAALRIVGFISVIPLLAALFLKKVSGRTQSKAPERPDPAPRGA